MDSLEGKPDCVTVDLVDAVAIVNLANPDTRNALSRPVLNELFAAISGVQSLNAEALVLAGQGKAFCAGGDLSAIRQALDGDTEQELSVMIDLLHDTVRALRSLPMPTVAAVDGMAVGAGMALALATDVRVVGRSATFVTGYLRVASSTDGGASFFLARMLGSGQALSSFVLNRRFDAGDLQRLGLADEVVEAGTATNRAVELARDLSVLSADALLAVRGLVAAATTHDVTAHLEMEKERFLSVARTPAFRRAMLAAGS